MNKYELEMIKELLDTTNQALKQLWIIIIINTLSIAMLNITIIAMKNNII